MFALALILGALGIIAASVAFAVQRQRRETPIPFLVDASEATENTPPSIDGGGSGGPGGRALAPREQRLAHLTERAHSGLCRYCEDEATYVVPEFLLIRSPLDPIYRYLGVVPVNRWRIVTSAGVRPELCGRHQEMVRGHMERRIADNQVDYAAFVERQRNEIYEFERFGLDEKMADDMAAIRHRRRGKRATVLAISPVGKASNGG